MTFQDVENLPLWTDMSYRGTIEQRLEQRLHSSYRLYASVLSGSNEEADCNLGEKSVSFTSIHCTWAKRRRSTASFWRWRRQCQSALPGCHEDSSLLTEGRPHWQASLVGSPRWPPLSKLPLLALSILLCPDLAKSCNQLAENILKGFVTDCKELYGPKFLV